MKRLIFLIIFVLPILACNINDNDPLPTLAPTLGAPGVKVTPPTAASAATKPVATQPAPAATQPKPAVTNTAPKPTTGAAQPDKGDELDKLLDELNNALKNMDTMDDVK